MGMLHSKISAPLHILKCLRYVALIVSGRKFLVINDMIYLSTAIG